MSESKKEYEMQANSESDTGCIAVSGKGYYIPLPEYLKQQGKIATLEQQLKQQWVSVDYSLTLLDRVLKEIENGFVPCAHCGQQEDTKDLDFVDDLKLARKLLVDNKPPTK